MNIYKIITPIIMFLICFLFFPLCGKAIIDDYFPNSYWKLKPFSLNALDTLFQDENSLTMGPIKKGKRTPLLKLHENAQQPEVMSLALYDESGRMIKDFPAVADCIFEFVKGFTADLNGDHKADYIVQIKTAATGLGNEQYFIVFVLSQENDYEATTLFDFDSQVIGPEFVNLDGNGQCQFIHTSITWMANKAGVAHSYWAYNILAIQGGKIVLANEAYPLFPKWVWYTVKPNHQPSRIVPRDYAVNWAKEHFHDYFWRPHKVS